MPDGTPNGAQSTHQLAGRNTAVWYPPDDELVPLRDYLRAKNWIAAGTAEAWCENVKRRELKCIEALRDRIAEVGERAAWVEHLRKAQALRRRRDKRR